MITWASIEKYWKRAGLIVLILAALGFNINLRLSIPTLLDEIQKSETFTETSHSALRSLMDLKATGIVKIDGSMVDIEIRRCGMVVESDTLEAEWAFVLNGHVEMYEAVYSPIWRGYHYVDFKGDYKQVKYLNYDEDYLRNFGKKEKDGI